MIQPRFLRFRHAENLATLQRSLNLSTGNRSPDAAAQFYHFWDNTGVAQGWMTKIKCSGERSLTDWP